MVYRHPSGWFTYARVDQTAGETRYFECRLTRDLSFAAMCAAAPGIAVPVTFHDDTICVRGARLDQITHSGHQLVGWQGDNVVLDGPII